MNGLPMTGNARRLIDQKRLFFVWNPDHTLIFNVQNVFFILYFTAKEGAALAIPCVNAPVYRRACAAGGQAVPFV